VALPRDEDKARRCRCPVPAVSSGRSAELTDLEWAEELRERFAGARSGCPGQRLVFLPAAKMIVALPCTARI